MRHPHPFSVSAAALAPLAGFLGVVLGGAGCTSNIDAHASPCTDDSTCLAGQTCAAGTCVDSASLGACTTDLDCDVSRGFVCLTGRCSAPPTSAPSSCADTRECPIDDYCNSATSACEPLIDGWCRSSSQCGAATPVCATDTPARAATCVQCVEDADCTGGQVCSAGNTCTGGGTSAGPTTCPANASLVPGSTTACQCNDGFSPNVTTHQCEAVSQNGGGSSTTTQCVPNASPVPNTTQCKCDPGFAPNAGGSACVPNNSTTTPPPNNNGGTGGTNPPANGGGVAPGGGSDTCGPNMISLFFVCVCDPGFVVNPNGPGCVAGQNDQTTPPGGTVATNNCPANATPNPNDATTCICDDGFVVDSAGTSCVPGTTNNGTGCPQNSSPDPTNASVCDCDPGFVADSTGLACVAGSPPVDNGCPAHSSPDATNSTLCDCDSGFIVDSSRTQCVADPNAGCPANSQADPNDPNSCLCDPGFVSNGSDCVDPNAGCPANSSIDPFDSSTCRCNNGYVVDSSGTQCVEDICAFNGYYGDGQCDTFCPFIDPDCQ